MNKQRQTGFTIIELVVVIVIIGILAAVALPRFLGLQDRAHDAVVEGTQAALNSGVMMANAVWQSFGKDNALDNIIDKKIHVLMNTGFCASESFASETFIKVNAPDESADMYKYNWVSLDANKRGYPVGHSQHGSLLSDADPASGKVDGASVGFGPNQSEEPTNCTGAVGGSANSDRDAVNNITTKDNAGHKACQEIFEFIMTGQSVRSIPYNSTGDFAGEAALAAEIEAGTWAHAMNNNIDFIAASNSSTGAGADQCIYTYLTDANPAEDYRRILYDGRTGRVTVENLTDSQYSAGS